jgi:hypothetical protein
MFNGTQACCPDTTIDAKSPTEYRHFSVDTDKNIVYFCDYKSYEKGVYCYWTKRDPLMPTSNVWTELPGYVSYIIGYSTSKGKI